MSLPLEFHNRFLRLAVTPRISTAREASNETQTRAIGGGCPAHESPRHAKELILADSKVPQILETSEDVHLSLDLRNDVVESNPSRLQTSILCTASSSCM